MQFFKAIHNSVFKANDYAVLEQLIMQFLKQLIIHFINYMQCSKVLPLLMICVS